MTASKIVFDANDEEFVKRVRAMEGKLFKVGKEGFVTLVENWSSLMRKDHFTGYYPGATRGTKLRTRTGAALKRSAGGRVLGDKLGNLRAVLRIGGGRAGYAALQEYGEANQTSTRTGGYMRIPLPRALTPGGALRSKAIPRKAGTTKGGGPIYMTGYGRTAVIKSGGKLFIVTRKKWRPKAKNMGNVLLFILKERVKIKPRLGATREVIETAGREVDRITHKFNMVLMHGEVVF